MAKSPRGAFEAAVVKLQDAPKAPGLRQRAMDTFVNFLAGIGVTGIDKRKSQAFAIDLLNPADLEMAYRGDWVSRKICDIPADDATRNWRIWLGADDDEVEQLEEAERTFNLNYKLNRALKLARLQGGAALIIGVDQGDPTEPLDLDKVTQDSLKYIHACGRWELAAGRIITDIASEWYGEPEYYTRRTIGGPEALVHIHPSRVVRFLGAEPPTDITQWNEGWADSILQVVYEACKDVGMVSAAMANIVADMKLDIYKVPGLTDGMMDSTYKENLLARFSYANTAKSVVNSLLMDKEEEHSRITTSLAGSNELLQAFLMIAAAAADIPVTRMLGQSPGGLNATGDSDTRNYYDRVAADQVNRLTPALNRLDETLIRSTLGARDDSIYYQWGSLWQLSDGEKATIGKTKADTWKIDVDSGMFNEDVMRAARKSQLIEDGLYPGFEAAVEEFGIEPEEPELPEGALPMVPGPDGRPIPPPGRTPPALAASAAAAAASARRPVEAVPAPRAANDRLAAMRDAMAKDARPRTLYIRREVRNAADIIRWAASQGFETTLPANDLHVTVAYSRTPVDWIKVGQDWTADDTEDGGLRIPPGGPRVVEMFGAGAIVLAFGSTKLAWRHESICQRGASWDYDDYNPHITITYKRGDLNLNDVEPYRGEILLGPEIFEEVKTEFNPEGVQETPVPDNPDNPPAIGMTTYDGVLRFNLLGDDVGGFTDFALNVEGNEHEVTQLSKRSLEAALPDDMPQDEMFGYELSAMRDGKRVTLAQGQVIWLSSDEGGSDD